MTDLLARFSAARVAVVGGCCLDSWYDGPARQLSREAPVPVVSVADVTSCPGGAANAATGVAALGAEVRFVTAVGDDTAGHSMLRMLAERGVSKDAVVLRHGGTTSVKRRVLSRGQLLLRVDSAAELGDGTEAALLEVLPAALDGVDAVLVADYDDGLLTLAVRAEVARLARLHGATLVVDAHRPDVWAALHPDVVTPDDEEVRALLPDLRLGDGSARVEEIAAAEALLREATGAAACVVTLDRDGAVVLDGSDPTHLVADTSPVLHTVGAGDTFTAALTLALAAGASLREAAEVGQAAAAVVVRQPATSSCRLADLRARLASQQTVLPLEALAACTTAHRALGRRVVMANGWFDGLHRGHLAHLRAARECGDVLVVALNSDTSTAHLRAPLHSAADRAHVLAEQAAVDHVVVFEADTISDLLRLARPDVWVKGGDYTEQMLREADLAHELGVEVRLLDWVDVVDAADTVDTVDVSDPGDGTSTSETSESTPAP